MSVKLSILIPSIRTENLRRLYDSIKLAFSGEFEAIVASPYPLPDNMQFDNVKLITTWRAPLAAQQEALTQATGEWVSWCADDGWCLPNSYDQAFQLLEGKDYKTIITGKYQEGERKDDNMEKIDYYILNNHHGSQAVFLPENSYMLNCGLVSRKLLLEVGGWDSREFVTCPPGYNDLAVRLNKYGCEFIIPDFMMFECTHMPGETGDHSSIHRAQTLLDEPKFREIWSHPYFSKRISVDLYNYKRTPEKWEMRFGK